MRRLAYAFVAAIVWTSSTEAASQSVLTMDGLGRVKIGMTIREAERALGAKLRVEYPEANLIAACGLAQRADDRVPEVFYMIEDGRITRIDIGSFSPESPGQSRHSPITTARGLGLGSNETDIEHVYRNMVSIEPHPYLGDEGHYLIIDEPNHRRGIIFETDRGKVISFRAGSYPSLGYIEGCL